MDQAKVGETKHFHFSLRHPELIDKTINAFLKKGWVIVTVKVVEQRTAYRYEDGSRHPNTQSSLFYVIGKPRVKPPASDGKREESPREFFERLDDQQAEAFHKEAAEAQRERAQRAYTECAVRLSVKIGKPFPVGASVQEVDAWLRKNLAIDDSDHPDYQIHAKSSS